MVGELIKEYLVGLGVKIDKPGFAEFDSTINKTSGVIASATGGWAKNFVTAAGIISTAIASVTTATAGLMNSVAKQDLAMEKYARSMMVTKGAAMEMKLAVDALGESVQDIQLTPELFGRYKALVADGRNMKVGGDYEGTMKNFRDLVFEFTRLKQEASYAMQWVGYYLNKYLSKPLADAKANFKEFNDKLIKDMPVWTEKIARALVYIINIGRHFWDLLKAIGKTIYDVWDAFPRGVKIATAALAGFFMVLNGHPLVRFLTLLGSVLLLADDYFGYMEGKQAALGGIWDKLNQGIDLSKQKITQWGRELTPVWDSFVEYLGMAKDGVESFGGQCMDWFERIGQSKELNDFNDTVEHLGKSFWNLGGGVIDLITDSCKSFFKSLEKQGIAVDFTDLMERLFYTFLDLVDVISEGIDTLGDWLREMGKSDVVRDFLDAVAEFLDVVLELILAILELVNVAFRAFFGELDKKDTVYSFKDALKAVVSVITAMIRYISELIRNLTKLFKMMSDNKIFKAFWEGLGKVVKNYVDIIMNAIKMTGKLGEALLELINGHPLKAAQMAKEALFGSGKEKGKQRYGSNVKNFDDFVNAVSGQESGGDYNAVNPLTGAYGKFQIMPENWSSWVSEAGLSNDSEMTPSNQEYVARHRLKQYYDELGAEGALVAWYAGYQNGVRWRDGETDAIGEDGHYSWDAAQAGGAPSIRDYVYQALQKGTNSYNPDVAYSIQSGVEDSDLGGVDPNLRNQFNELANYLHEQGYGIEVSSGWRSVENNAASGGAPNSKHLDGGAIDFVITNDYDPEQIKAIIEQYGMSALYHDVGSGYHFHIQVDDNAPQYELKNPSEGMHDPTWWDYAKEKMSGIFKPTSYVQSAVENIDPFLLQGFKGGSQPSYASMGNGGTTIINKVDVGGVIVNDSNASADDIGNAVGDKTTSSLESRSEYILQNRTVTGGPSWV